MLDICSVFHKIYERFWLSVLMLREKMYVFTEYTFFVGVIMNPGGEFIMIPNQVVLLLRKPMKGGTK